MLRVLREPALLTTVPASGRGCSIRLCIRRVRQGLATGR
ncbi:hypothetical protein FM103_09740 [Corynebacterium xerosis]|nr:hypothetical protein FM103_09740 [Corynebacterium xerosis]